MTKPSAQPRPMGGFNQGFGNFNEHLDEDAMQSALQQKALGQQSTSAAQSTTGGSALQQLQQAGMSGVGGAGGLPPAPPRELGTITEELVQRPIADIKAGLQSFFDINSLLAIDPKQDDPQTQIRKKKTLQNWQKLNSEQQQYAQRVYQEKLKKKQQEEQEQQLRKQQEEQRKAQEVVMPSSPQKGPIGPGGSQKPRAVQKLEQDRKTLGGPQSAN